jgi:hypothetical protein
VLAERSRLLAVRRIQVVMEQDPIADLTIAAVLQ